jgi:hypothetical protein
MLRSLLLEKFIPVGTLLLLMLHPVKAAAEPEPNAGAGPKSAAAKRVPKKRNPLLPETHSNLDLKPSLPSDPWHTWSDSEGRTVRGELLYIDGNHVGIKAESGQTYRLNLTKLVPADREFAEKAARLLPGPSVPAATAAARIDALVNAGLEKNGQKRNPPLAEDQLVRRLYLDVAGRIPTAVELLGYLNDKAPDKRSRLIDKLLASEGFNSQWFDWLGDMLRLKDDYGKGVKSYVYQEWIKEQIAANRHWDALVYDLMTAEGRITNTGPVGYLLRDRGMPLDNLSNTLTTFLGANVACAQCHDHPMASWTQRNFYEMAAFFGATEQGFSRQDARKAARTLDIDKRLAQRILFPNYAQVDTLPANKLTFPKDYQYDDAKPGGEVHPKLISWSKTDEKNPAYAGAGSGAPSQWRDQFAVWLTHPDNPRFAAAIANRIWKKFFGLGVQEPITDLDNLNEAVNPDLLQHLAAEMKRVHFDLREFQRIILHTHCYQAQCSPTPKPDAGPYQFPGPILRRMRAEQTWDSVLTLVVGEGLDQFKLRRADQVRKLDLDTDHITKDAILAKAKMLESGAKRAGKKASEAQITESQFDGNPPPRMEGLLLARASELPQPSKESHFLRNFGQSDREIADSDSLEGGVPQVLMLMNGEVQKVLANPNAMVLREASKSRDPAWQVRFLYVSFLGRLPSPEEARATGEMLAQGLSIKDLSWVLLNTREFLFVQ